jgi:hypothetical protein
LFGQLSELHQFGFRGTSLKQDWEHLQIFNKPYLFDKKEKELNKFQEIRLGEAFPTIPLNSANCFSVRRYGWKCDFAFSEYTDIPVYYTNISV